MPDTNQSSTQLLRATSVPGAKLVTEPITVQQATAGIWDTMFKLLVATSDHAQKVVLPEVSRKIDELKILASKEAELQTRGAQLDEEARKLNDESAGLQERKSAFELEKAKWTSVRADTFLDPTRYALPISLREKSAREFIDELIRYFDDGDAGQTLRIWLSFAAFAEAKNEEQDFLRAIQELYPPALQLDPESRILVPKLRQFLTVKNVADPIVIELPSSGAPWDPDTMVASSDLATKGRISRVVKWGVKFSTKDKRKKTVVA